MANDNIPDFNPEIYVHVRESDKPDLYYLIKLSTEIFEKGHLEDWISDADYAYYCTILLLAEASQKEALQRFLLLTSSIFKLHYKKLNPYQYVAYISLLYKLSRFIISDLEMYGKIAQLTMV